MARVEKHIEESEVRKYLKGELPEKGASEMELHLLECDRCAETVNGMADKDTFIDILETRHPDQDEADDLATKIRHRLRDQVTKVPENAHHEHTMVHGEQPAPGAIGASFEETEVIFDYLSPAEQPGEIGRLGGYRVLRILGKGGMGIVFEAEDPQLERRVALKVMKREIAAHATSKKRFVREAKVTAALNHDNVITIYQVGEDRDTPFLAMELLEGETLDERLEKGEIKELAEVLRVCKETAKGLAAAHKKGLVHRDIKPANLWLDANANDRVKILDFGLARASEAHDDKISHSGTIIGTPAYMPPEQTRGEPATARSDLFSLGCMMYRLVTGKLPFRGKDTISTLVAIASENPTPPEKLSEDLPPKLNRLIMRLLEKDEEKRPGTATKVVQYIELIEQELSNKETVELPKPPVAAPVQQAAPTQPPDVVPAAPQLAEDGPIKSPNLPSQRRPAKKKVRRPAANTTPVQEREATPAPRRMGKIVAGIVLLVLVGGGLIFGGTIYRFVTDQGVLVIEVEDPGIEVVVKVDGAVVRDKTRDREFTLKTTENGQIEVFEKNGVSLLTKKFSLSRNGKTTITVSIKEIADAKKPEDPTVKKPPVVAPPKYEPAVPGKNNALLYDESTLKLDASRFNLPGLKEWPLKAWTLEMLVNTEQAAGGSHVDLLQLSHLVVSMKLHPKGWVVQHDSKLLVRAKDVPTGRWVHVAAVCDGEKLRLYFDGKLAKEAAGPSKDKEGAKAPSYGVIARGGFLGLMDEIRVSKVARYSKDFTPLKPNQRLTSDKDTIVLFHCDGEDATKLMDSSGNGNHGKLKTVKRVRNSAGDAPPEPKYKPAEPGKNNAVLFDNEGSFYPANFHLTKAKEWPVKTWTLETLINFKEAMNGKKQKSVLFVNGTLALAVASGKWVFYPGGVTVTDAELPIDQWAHVALVCNGKKVRFFLDGKLKAESDKTTPDGDPQRSGAVGQQSLNAMMDEIRLSSVARYTRDFMPLKSNERFVVDKDTLLLYHCDGAEPDTLTDSSGNGHNATRKGLTRVRNTAGEAPSEPKYEPAAAGKNNAIAFANPASDGKRSIVEIPTLKNPGGTGPMCIEGFVTLTKHSVEYVGPFGFPYGLAIQTNNSPQSDRSGWKVFGRYAQGEFFASTKQIQPLNKRFHIAAVRDGKEVRLYIDGKKVGSTTLKEDNLPGNQLFLIGFGLNGMIDEIRVSQTARYKDNFTPAERFEPDKLTLALYHCDEHTGDVIKDSSGNNHHGKLSKTVSRVRAQPLTGSELTAPTGFQLYFDGSQAEGAFWKGKFPERPGQITVEGTYFIPRSAKNSSVLSAIGSWAAGGSGLQGIAKRGDSLALWGKGSGSWTKGKVSFPYDRPFHAAFVADGKEARLYVDGKQGFAIKDSRELQESVIVLGMFHFKGWMKDVRISSSARYTKDFTPPTEMKPDPSTLGLYRCDEGNGKVLKDSSGNDRHGEIIGAKWVKGGTASSTDIDRKAAEYILATGAFIYVDVNGRLLHVPKIERLPEEPFQLKNVDVRNKLLPPEGFFIMGQCEHLDYVHMATPHFTDAMLEELCKCKSITQLLLKNAKVTDEGLKHLHDCKNLKKVELFCKGVTAEGVAGLKKSLPMCDIDWSGKKP